MNQREVNALCVRTWNLYVHLSITGRDTFARRYQTCINVLTEWNRGYCTATSKLGTVLHQFEKELLMRRTDPTFWIEASKTAYTLFED